MGDKTLVLFYTVAAFCVVALKLAKSRARDPIGYILLFYFFFGFGPVINYLLDLPIYFGIVTENIPEASLIMLVGIGSFALPHLVWNNPKLEMPKISNERHDWEALKIAFAASCLYGAGKIALMMPMRIAGASKIQMINIALPQLHYIYLLIQLYLSAFYFSVKERPGLGRLYWLNIAIYIVYCLVVTERDFIFPLISIFIMRSLVGENKLSLIKMLAVGISFVLFGTMMFFFRDSNQEASSVLAATLSQGSILFINTFVLKVFQNGHDFFLGETFLNSLINLAPSWVYKTDYNNLDWFKNLYAAASDSGYGFALDAEGYINFGYAGVVMVFGSIALYWKLLLSKFEKSEFYRYLCLFSVGFVMYALRNDSLALIKGIVYAMIIYLALNTGSYLLSLRNR